MTVSQLIPFWQGAGVPTSLRYDIEKCLLHTHSEWQGLMRNIKRRSEQQEANEKNFSEKLDKTFDIAHQNADKLNEVKEDRDFLAAKRHDCKGYMTAS